MGNTIFPAERYASLSGSVSCLNGTVLPFDSEDVVSFSGVNGVRNGMLPGAVVSQNCTLLLYDRDRRYTLGRSLFGAQVTVRMEMDGETYPLAVFFVHNVSQNDGSSFLTLTGSDALGCAFDGLWQDQLSYPASLGTIAQAALSVAGFSLDEGFSGQEQLISRKPNWGEISLRGVLSHVAGACGCFCMVTGDGKVKFVPAWQNETPYEIHPEQTFKRVYGDASFGPLTGIKIALDGANRDAAPLTLQVNETPLDGFNSLSISKNPLFMQRDNGAQSLAQNLLSRLQGMAFTRLMVHWQGDAHLTLGKHIRVFDTQGGYTDACVTSLGCTVDSSGFSMQTDCNFQSSSSSVGRVFTANGGLNAALLQGTSDGAFLKAESITAQHLAGQSVTAEKLAAGSVTAEKIASGSITADKIAAGAISADAVKAVTAEIQRLIAEGITTDELYVSLATIANAQIETADIDFSHIKDLVTDQAIITEGVGNQLYIARLAVTEANMVSLSVGELLVKGTDGGFYAVSVDNAGNIVTERKQIANGDVQNLSINAGEKLIEGSVTAKTLNVQDIFADSAIIRELMAANIDVDTLFAREATLDAINALDIRGNRYLRLTVDGLAEEMEAKTSDATGQQMTLSFDRGSAFEIGKESITSTVHVWKNGEDVTAQIPNGAFTWQRISGDGAADAAWAESHKGMKSITLSRLEIGKSCQVSCTLNAKGYYGYFDIIDGVLQIKRPDDGAADAFALQNGDLHGEDSYFIDEDGYIYRRNVPGQMTVTSTVFDHTVLETSHILIKDEKIEISSGGDVHVKAGGTFTVDSGNFDIDADGNVILKGEIEAGSGNIGGWNILPGSLQSGSGESHVRLSTEDATYGIWAGADSPSGAPFRVARDGTVYLTKLYVTDENGVAQQNPVNLRTSYWKMDKAYARAVQSITVDGDTLTITLYDGTSVNFKKPSQAISLEGAWSGTTWTVTGQNDSEEKTISTTISANQSAWSAENKKQVMVYANNSPTYLIQMIVDASDVHASGYHAGWNECIDNFSLEGAWRGTTWTVTGQNDSYEETISTTISASQSAWSAENKKQVTVYANNSPTYLIQMIVDASDVHTSGYHAGWNECIDNCVEDPGSYRITSQSPYELYVKNGDNYSSVGSGWVKVAQTYGRYTIPQKKT